MIFQYSIFKRSTYEKDPIAFVRASPDVSA